MANYSVDYVEGHDQEQEMLLAQNEEYLRTVIVEGREIDDFLRTAAGRNILGRSMQAVADAVNVFLYSDMDTEEGLEDIRRAKRAARDARSALQWLCEAVHEGRQSEEHYHETYEPTGQKQ